MSVIYFKRFFKSRLSFTIITDDVFFLTGTGLERVGVAGLDLDCWRAGMQAYWIAGVEIGLPLLLIGWLWMWYSPAKTRKKGGR